MPQKLVNLLPDGLQRPTYSHTCDGCNIEIANKYGPNPNEAFRRCNVCDYDLCNGCIKFFIRKKQRPVNYMPKTLRNNPFESAIRKKKSLKESSEINEFCNNFDQDKCNELTQQYDNSSIRKVVSSMKINK